MFNTNILLFSISCSSKFQKHEGTKEEISFGAVNQKTQISMQQKIQKTFEEMHKIKQKQAELEEQKRQKQAELEEQKRLQNNQKKKNKKRNKRIKKELEAQKRQEELEAQKRQEELEEQKRQEQIEPRLQQQEQEIKKLQQKIQQKEEIKQLQSIILNYLKDKKTTKIFDIPLAKLKKQKEQYLELIKHAPNNIMLSTVLLSFYQEDKEKMDSFTKNMDNNPQKFLEKFWCVYSFQQIISVIKENIQEVAESITEIDYEQNTKQMEEYYSDFNQKFQDLNMQNPNYINPQKLHEKLISDLNNQINSREWKNNKNKTYYQQTIKNNFHIQD